MNEDVLNSTMYRWDYLTDPQSNQEIALRVLRWLGLSGAYSTMCCCFLEIYRFFALEQFYVSLSNVYFSVYVYKGKKCFCPRIH